MKAKKGPPIGSVGLNLMTMLNSFMGGDSNRRASGFTKSVSRRGLPKEETIEFQRILAKEGLLPESGIDGIWGSATEKAFQKSKTFSHVDPSFKEGLVRSVLPDNLGQLVNKQTGSARMGDSSLDKEQRRMLLSVIQNAVERTGKNTGGTEYSDYSPQIANRVNRGAEGSLPEIAVNTATDPLYRLATTIGRGRYWPDPENPGGYIYTDVYDWNKGEQNFKEGKNSNWYRQLRNTVRSGEEGDRDYNKNDDFRMNFRIHPDEFTR